MVSRLIELFAAFRSLTVPCGSGFLVGVLVVIGLYDRLSSMYPMKLIIYGEHIFHKEIINPPRPPTSNYLPVQSSDALCIRN